MFAIIQNDPKVTPGTIGEILTEEGVAFRVVHPYEGEALPQVGDVTGAIILGGAMGVHDVDRYPFLGDVNGFIRDCVGSATPLLGVCLGGQLMADALGAEVSINLHREKGMCSVTIAPEGKDDPLFAGLPEEFLSFQWHNDSFALPADAVHLAFSAACPNQAFRIGTNAYGVQFHPEVDRAIVEAWTRGTKPSSTFAERIMAGFLDGESAYRNASRGLMLNFIKIADRSSLASS